MTKVICPHCNKEDDNFNLNKAARNAEGYGDAVFTFQCTNCKKKYSIQHIRKVVRGEPYQRKDDVDTSF